MLETLDHTIRIGSTPTFLYFDLYLYSAYAAHYVYAIFSLIAWAGELFCCGQAGPHKSKMASNILEEYMKDIQERVEVCLQLDLYVKWTCKLTVLSIFLIVFAAVWSLPCINIKIHSGLLFDYFNCIQITCFLILINSYFFISDRDKQRRDIWGISRR